MNSISFEVSSTERKFQTKQVLTIVSGHFIHDVYSAFFAPLLPLLIEKLSLSLALAGSLTAFMQLPSLLNPFIGYLDDILNLRYFLIIAPAITGTLMSLLGLMPDYYSLAALLLITGVSIAIFHAPAPAMIARVSGNQVGKGMSYFMAGGELGRTIGPIVVVSAVAYWGLDNLYYLAAAGWIATIALFLRFRNIPTRLQKKTGVREMLPTAKTLFIPLSFIILARSFIITSISVFLPTFLSQEGLSLFFAGSALAIYEFAGVGGALFSGTVSDRWGRKPILLVVFSLSALLLILFTQLSGWVIIPVLLLLGFVSLSSQPVLLALVQDQLPDHRAIANGIFLAISFLSRPVATTLIGYFGDITGLRTAFIWSAIIALISVPIVLTLPNRAKNIFSFTD